MKIVFLIFFTLFYMMLHAQKDSLKKTSWSIEAGLILNNAYSHYDEAYYSKNYGTSVKAVPSSTASPLNFGACLGFNYHINAFKHFPLIFNLGLSYSEGQYKEEGGITREGNGSHGSTYTYTEVFNNEVSAKYIFMCYGLGLKTKIYKNLHMQNTLSLLFALYDEKTIEILNKAPQTSSDVFTGVAPSYRFCLFYQVKTKQNVFDVYLSRSFSLNGFELPLWSIGLRYYLN